MRSGLLMVLLCPVWGGGNEGLAQVSTRQAVKKSALIRPDISKTDVMSVIGVPVKTELMGQKEAWHFCRTGTAADEFAVSLFNDGKVVDVQPDTAALSDVGGATGDCSVFVKCVLQ